MINRSDYLNRKNIGIVIFAVILMIITTVMGVSVSASAVRPSLSRNSVVITVGKTTTLKVRRPSEKVRWRVSGRKLITIRPYGFRNRKVKLKAGKGTGTCRIIARVGKRELRCRIVVKPEQKKSGNTIPSGDDDRVSEGTEPENKKAAGMKTDSLVIVSVNGGGDYTSLTQALYETKGDVTVKAGTYDIVAEYRRQWGENIFTVLSDRTQGMGLFQYGPFVDRRAVTFEKGAVVVCDITGTGYDNTTDNHHRFSPINMGSNAVLDGLVCRAKGTWYVIHDDFGDKTHPYKNVIRNCTLVGSDLTYINVIGGGTREKSVNVIRNCVMDNGLGRDSETMRYHNYNSPNAAPSVIVEDCTVNGYIGARWYGAQTDPKMTFTVRNCTCGSRPRALAETDDFDSRNVILIVDD